MVMRLTISFLLAAGLLLPGCSSSSPETPSPSSAKDSKTGTKTRKNTDACLKLLAATPTYDDDVKDIIDGSCATNSCHADGGQVPILTDYKKVKKNSTRIAAVVADQSMPPRDTVDESDANVIAKWAEQGFRENEDDEIKSEDEGDGKESVKADKSKKDEDAEEACDG
jgi:hypothetical protein